MKERTFIPGLVIAVVLGAGFAVVHAGSSQAAAPQPAPGDQEINEAVALTRAGLAADRKQVIAANLEITPDEAAKFWPVYDEYQKAMATVSDRRVNLILDYARHYESMTDDKASELITEAMTFEKERVETRHAWMPKFAAVLPGKKLARFYQLDNKIDALVNVALAEDIPLVK